MNHLHFVSILGQELEEIQSNGIVGFSDVQVDEQNMFAWQGVIVPDSAPYNKGAFRVDIRFPLDYPFKPPKVTFKTKIYHPNVDEKGQVCLPIIQPENWKPATRTIQGQIASFAITYFAFTVY